MVRDALVATGSGLRRLTNRTVSLEDVFLEVDRYDPTAAGPESPGSESPASMSPGSVSPEPMSPAS